MAVSIIKTTDVVATGFKTAKDARKYLSDGEMEDGDYMLVIVRDAVEVKSEQKRHVFLQRDRK